MKKFSILASLLFGFVAASLQAGSEVYKQVAPPPPPELYGLGFYGAIDMGANVFQDRGGTRTFTGDFGDTLTVDPKNDVGFFGGVKLGYVFLTGVVRPTIEGDFFYNGFRGGANFTLRDSFGDVLAQRDATTWINSGAFMGNFILRFDLAWQIIAGTDYYWNPKFSTFIEYKFLNYTSTQINTNENRNLGQQLVGAGVRLHF